jgi:hypothetical protein
MNYVASTATWSRECQLTFSGLHGATAQKRELCTILDPLLISPTRAIWPTHVNLIYLTPLTITDRIFNKKHISSVV